jgi:hypothetical protein
MGFLLGSLAAAAALPSIFSPKGRYWHVPVGIGASTALGMAFGIAESRGSPNSLRNYAGGSLCGLAAGILVNAAARRSFFPFAFLLAGGLLSAAI